MVSQETADHLIVPLYSSPAHNLSETILSELLATVKRLENENALLLAENKTLSTQVISRHHSASFRKFSELPKEIRCLIWRSALRAPQNHIIGGTLSKNRLSTVNITMQACHEALEEGIAMKLPYISMRYGSTEYSPFAKPIATRNYMNFDQDTMWAGTSSGDIYCSICKSTWSTGNIVPAKMMDCKCVPRKGLKALVYDRDTFYDKVLEADRLTATVDPWIYLKQLVRCNAQNIYVVVEVEGIENFEHWDWLKRQRVGFVPVMEASSDNLGNNGPVKHKALLSQTKGEKEMLEDEIEKLRKRISADRRLQTVNSDVEALKIWKVPDVVRVQARLLSGRSH